jgi:hypothetical protein
MLRRLNELNSFIVENGININLTLNKNRIKVVMKRNRNKLSFSYDNLTARTPTVMEVFEKLMAGIDIPKNVNKKTKINSFLDSEELKNILN